MDAPDVTYLLMTLFFLYVAIGMMAWSLIHATMMERDYGPGQIGCFFVITVALWPVLLAYIFLKE